MQTAFVLDVNVDIPALLERAVNESESNTLDDSQDKSVDSDTLPVCPRLSSIWDGCDHDTIKEDGARHQTVTVEPPAGKKFR